MDTIEEFRELLAKKAGFDSWLLLLKNRMEEGYNIGDLLTISNTSFRKAQVDKKQKREKDLEDIRNLIQE